MYKIVDTHKKINIETGLDTREDAKPKRNGLNNRCGDEAVGDAKPRFVISRDAMHPLGETDGHDHTVKQRWV